jgi:hypothetical protein
MSESEGLHAAPNATVPYPGGAHRFGLAGSRTTRSPESAAGTELTTESAATAETTKNAE